MFFFKIFERLKRDFVLYFVGLRYLSNIGNVRYFDFVFRSIRFGFVEYRIYRYMVFVFWWFTDCFFVIRFFVVKISRELKEKRVSCFCLYYVNSIVCRRIFFCVGDISFNFGFVIKCYKCEKSVKKN